MSFMEDLTTIVGDPGNSEGAFGLPSLGDTTKAFTGQTGAEASLTAARENIDFQREALDYLREEERIPGEVRKESLQKLQGIYGGGEEAEAFNQTLRDDPFYQSQIDQSEEAILRNASAMGGIRGGTTPAALAKVSPAIMQSMRNEKLQGLQSLALGVPSNQSEQANLYSKMGDITAMGGLGAAQSMNQGASNMAGMATGIMAMFSDRRLKSNAVKIGEKNGLNVYTWDWNDKAEELGLKGSSQGHMADEVEKKYPNLVFTDISGYKKIDMGGLENAK